MPGVDFAAAIREGNRDNGLGTIQGRERGNQAVKDTSDVAGREDKGEERFFITPQGEIYGFVAPNGDVIQTANYEYTMNYKGAGEFDIIEYHQLDNNKYERINDKENRGFRGSIDRVSSGDEFTKDKYPIHNYDVANRETAGNNADLDKRTSQGESQQTQNNGDSQEYQGRSTRLSRYHKENVS